MDLSIVIPVRNEAENIAPLVAEIRAALDGALDYEIVYVDDGSADATAAEIAGLAVGFTRLRLIRHRVGYGQSAAIRTGVKAARAPWIATLDGDGQNDPADIPGLWAMARQAADAPALITGQRTKRRDTWTKRVSSRVANRVRAMLLGDGTPDSGCGLKLFRRDLFLELPFFDHMHRFLPARLGPGQPPAPYARALQLRHARPSRGRVRGSARRHVAAAAGAGAGGQ